MSNTRQAIGRPTRLRYLREYIHEHGLSATARALQLSREATARLAGEIDASPGTIALAEPAIDRLRGAA